MTELFFAKEAVKATPELRRILSIPRRSWTPEDADDLAKKLTAVLRTPNGEMSLRPHQAIALAEIGTQRGGFFPIRVGGGKTLISLLAPYILGAVRPILILPASLVEKTAIEMGRLMKHWLIPRNIRIVSYEILGRVQSQNLLAAHRPDLFVLDEAHRVKNPRAGVTRRFKRYMAEHPDTPVVVMSGTMIKHGVRDFAPLLRFALKANAPVPDNDDELEQWGECLDDNVPLRRLRPGALLDLCTPEERQLPELQAARVGFQRRLLDTPAVVATSGDSVSCSLYCQGRKYDTNAVTDVNFSTLRNAWETPDGWSLSQAVDVWRHAGELALGFHYVWDPRPPEEWLQARKAWAKYVRDVLSHSRHLDTELQVRKAVAAGELLDGRDILADWARLEPTFTANQKAIWHDTSALELSKNWMAEKPGIVWVSHREFGMKLSALTGAPYYGQGAVNRQGQPIMDEKGDRSIIASIRACSTGQNLQHAFSRNLIASALNGADVCEQLIGRTHRDGQDADEVSVEFLIGCAEHVEAFARALAGAEMARDTLGQPQKLLLADISVPTVETMRTWPGARWSRTPLESGVVDTKLLLARLLESEGL